ncbi:ROK family protein [Patescibacteria group bacterium]
MYIAIDLGGTNTRIASSKDLENIFKEDKFNTSSDVNKQKALISKSVEKVSEGEIPEKICFGVPGLIDKDKFLKVPSISDYNGVAFSDFFEGNYELVVQNDAALAGLAEATRGAGKEYDTVAYLTLSTGIGGSLVQKGTVRHLEPGHMIIDKDKSLEDLISGGNFEKNYGKLPQDCVDEKIWMDYTGRLSIGIVNIVAMWSPEIIVLGGGMVNKFHDFIYPLLMKSLENQVFFEIPLVKKAHFMDEAGLIGGFIYLSQK